MAHLENSTVCLTPQGELVSPWKHKLGLGVEVFMPCGITVNAYVL